MNNRTIKFRAWDKEEKRMLDWYHHADLIKDAIPSDCGDEWTERCVVMQYVGFNDKNDKEIYEGDIVKDHSNLSYYKIIWSDEDCAFLSVNLTDESEIHFITRKEPEDFEVVGHIFDGGWPQFFKQDDDPDEYLMDEKSFSEKKRVTLSGQPPADGTEHLGAPQPIDPETGMHKDYWVLPEEERKKGFVRPYRDQYKHNTCGTVTNMGRALSETYARDPKYYGATFCAGCKKHFPVSEFVWTRDGQTVGS